MQEPEQIERRGGLKKSEFRKYKINDFYLEAKLTNLSEECNWLLAKRLWISNIAVNYLHKIFENQAHMRLP